MNNKVFGEKQENRPRKFAISIITLSGLLPNTTESPVIKNMVTKSVTSIGANYREVNRARSKADFKKKLKYVEGKPMKQFTG